MPKLAVCASAGWALAGVWLGWFVALLIRWLLLVVFVAAVYKLLGSSVYKLSSLFLQLYACGH